MNEQDYTEVLRRNLEELTHWDVEGLVKARGTYGLSWKRRGGAGAFMMLARKWDRIENLCRQRGYDVFEAFKADQNPTGIIDDIRDLRRYLLLVEETLLASIGEIPPSDDGNGAPTVRHPYAHASLMDELDECEKRLGLSEVKITAPIRWDVLPEEAKRLAMKELNESLKESRKQILELRIEEPEVSAGVSVEKLLCTRYAVACVCTENALNDVQTWQCPEHGRCELTHRNVKHHPDARPVNPEARCTCEDALKIGAENWHCAQHGHCRFVKASEPRAD